MPQQPFLQPTLLALRPHFNTSRQAASGASLAGSPRGRLPSNARGAACMHACRYLYTDALDIGSGVLLDVLLQARKYMVHQ